MVPKMAINVKACKESTKVKVEDSGNIESMMYLLPTAANSEPTLNPKRDSMLSA